MEVIDWSQLKIKDGKQDKSFELFCYCIAQKKYGHLGNFTSIDGAGGDGGIEFYIELENGKVWGWQAKFFKESGRLSLGGRQKQITKSLVRACDQYGTRLEKWILCTNSEFTPKEVEWFKTILPQERPADLDVKFDHWDEADFDSWLVGNEDFRGLVHYFFGKIALTTNWFKDQFETQFELVKSKFEKELHTEHTKIYQNHIQPLLFEQETAVEFQKKLSRVGDNYNGYKYNKSGLFQIDNDSTAFKKYLKELEKILLHFEGKYKDCFEAISKLSGYITPNQVKNLKSRSGSIDNLLKELEEYQRVTMVTFFDKLSDVVSKEKLKEESGRALNIHVKLNTDSILSSMRYACSFLESRIEANDKHFFGDKGIGKTHLCCSIASNLIAKSQPVIFIPAVKFKATTELSVQLKQILDIPETFSFSDLLDALNMAAFAQNVRCPIIIDGINESVTANGRLNPIWATDLPALIKKVSTRNNLVLITTCRPSYEDAIWEENAKRGYSNRVHLGGLSYEDTDVLVRKYFKHYKINADLTYLALNRFEKPLHLRIFCEAKNPERKKDVEVELGDELIYDSFLDFISICDASIYNYRRKKFDVVRTNENKTVASEALKIIGKYLWENHTRHIEYDVFHSLIDQDSSGYSSSKTNALINEGLLLCRDYYDEKEVVSITYEMMAGYAISNYLFERHKNEIPKFIKSKEAFNKLFTNDFRERHPHYEDILDCFAALLPKEIGKHLYELLPKGKKYKAAFGLAYDTIFKVSSEFITTKETAFVSAQLEEPENFKDTIRKSKHLFCSTKNLFNIKFWSAYLLKLSLVERDLSWSEFIRENNFEVWTMLRDFEDVVRSPEISKLKEDRTHLIAEYALWSMTTVNIRTRDKASKSLYYYGRRFPEQFLELFKLSFMINDIVVRERMILLAYGIVLARQYDFNDNSYLKKYLPVLAKTVYDFLFKKNAKYATTHIHIRDAGKCIIEVAQKYDPKLFSKTALKRIYPPYKEGGIRDWKVLTDNNDYKDGNMPMDFYFQERERPFLVSGDKYKPSPAMKEASSRLFWRATELGYTFEDFEYLDRTLARYKHYENEDISQIIKYGEKYCMIAFFELAGYMMDTNTLSKYDDLENTRFRKKIIDPTFPIEFVGNRDFFQKSLLEVKTKDLKKWVHKSKAPNITTILQTKDLNKENKDWVLLNCIIYQTEEVLERKVELNSLTIFVDSKKAKNLLRLLKEETKFMNLYDTNPGDSICYQGEIPCATVVPKNGIHQFYYKVDTEVLTREVTNVFLIQDGKRLSKTEEGILIEEIKNKYDLGIMSPPKGSGIAFICFKTHGNENTLEQVFEEYNVSEEVEIKNEEYSSDIEDSIPYHSPLCREDERFLSKEMAEYLSLVNQPQSFNLFEKDGSLATLNFKYGEGYLNKQSFLYIRKDLLDQYLSDHNLTMLHIVQGERLHYIPGFNTKERIDPPYKLFSEVREYKT